jgi:hypothetical protein
MTNKVNHDHLFTVEDLIYDAIVTYPKSVKACQVSLKRYRFDVMQILSQPVNALHNTSANLLV